MHAVPDPTDYRLHSAVVVIAVGRERTNDCDVVRRLLCLFRELWKWAVRGRAGARRILRLRRAMIVGRHAAESSREGSLDR